MNLGQLSIVLLLGHAVFCYGQSVSINYDIDSTLHRVSEPLNLWLNFLNSPDDSTGAVYWNPSEVERFGRDSYFLIENELQFGTDNFLGLLKYADIKVLSVRTIDEYHQITSLMEFPRKGQVSNVQYIFHVYAAASGEELKLFNPLFINARLYLARSTVGFINFHYPKSHKFNLQLAQRQNDFLLELSESFGVAIDTIDYYFAPTTAAIQEIKGFDFIIGDNGIPIPSGKADAANRLVYSAGLDEYYPHEFIHILLNPAFPNCHLWINEGVATFFGMSRGQSLDWHLRRLHDHLRTHPEIDLNNMLKLRSMDRYTDYRYVLGGFIVRQAFTKGGYELIKALMNAGKTDEDFYAAIDRHLGLKRLSLNSRIRAELARSFGDGKEGQ